GGISLIAADGSIMVAASGGGIAVAGLGGVTLEALGAGHQVLVNAAIATAGGDILIGGAGGVRNTDDGVSHGRMDSRGGAIALTSSGGDVGLAGDIVAAGGMLSVTAAGAIGMADGKVLSSE